MYHVSVVNQQGAMLQDSGSYATLADARAIAQSLRDMSIPDSYKIIIKIGLEIIKEYLSRNERNHRSQANRKAREDALSNLGLVKVRGALGGVYWE